MVNWLKAQGLAVTGVASDRLTIQVRGTSGTFEKALSTRINNYSYQGRAVFGASGAPQLPAGVAGSVRTILGLSNVIKPRPEGFGFPPIPPPPPGGYQCGSGFTPVQYTPQQIVEAYDWPSLLQGYGEGVTIANATAASANFSIYTVSTFWHHFKLLGHSVTVHTVDSNTATDGTGETTMDEEWAGALAPEANLLVYDGKESLAGFHDVYSAIVGANLAQIVTTSWGYPEGQTGGSNSCGSGGNCLDVDHQLFEQAAAQGITVVAATGDRGGAVVTYPSTDPNVVAAGGTRLVLKANGLRKSETVWNDYYGATGGGISSVFAEPAWQHGSGVPQNGYRNTSDLSLDADPCTGYDVYVQGQWLLGGGTSVVAPELAALFADFVSLSPNEERLGAADPALYADARSSTYSIDFHDITQGANDFHGTGGYGAGAGWDHPTGWGTVDGTRLLSDLEGGIALSPPVFEQSLSAGCVGYRAKMQLIWGPGIAQPVSYEVDEAYQGVPGWTNIYSGTLPALNFLLPAYVSSVKVRVRTWNGQRWSAYAGPWTLHGADCGGGGGGPPPLP